LSFDHLVFGDPILGDQLDLAGWSSVNGSMLGLGTVNLFEASVDDPNDLNNLQPATFTLAILTFNTVGFGHLLYLSMSTHWGMRMATRLRLGWA
jgi:hypothetical protein